MTPVVIAILTAVVQGLPQIEAAIAALVKMAQNQPLSDADNAALGAAMVAAHQRAQGQPVT